MREFTPEKLYVPLDYDDPARNRALASALRGTGVRLVLGVNAVEIRGIPSVLKNVSKQGYRQTFFDMDYRSVGSNIERSLSLFESLQSVGYVSVDGRDSLDSLKRAAAFDDGLKITSKAIDSAQPEDEFTFRNGRSPLEATKSIAEAAHAVGISCLIGAGVDVKEIEMKETFATGIRPRTGITELGDFNDDQARTIDPIEALSVARSDMKLVVGRPITTARDPEAAVQALVGYINRG